LERGGNLEEWEVRIIGALVREAVKSGWLPPADADDLAQEATLKWWRIRDRYRERPGGSAKAYLRRSIRRFLKDKRVKLAARKRAGWKEESLEEEEGVVAKEEEMIEERFALGAAIRTLDSLAQKVAGGLAIGETPTCIAEDLAVSRQRVYRAITRIREALRAAGFK